MHPSRVLILLLASFAWGGEVALFNGNDLSGWVQEGPRATFSVADGELRTSGRGGHPNWLRTEREYENFRLRFEYRVKKWAEAAVILRAPRRGRPMRSGVALTLAHDYHGLVTDRVTGAIAGVVEPGRALPESFEEWHRVDLMLDGSHLKATIDDVVVQDLDLSEHPELRHRLARGYIGFPDMDHSYSLRNVRIEQLADRVQLVDLINGPSLDGWDLRGGGNWSLSGGIITGANGDGILYAPGVYGNFELSALVRSHNRVNSGIFLHGVPSGGPRGFEVQIYSPPDSVYPTGSIYKVARSRVSADLEEEWFLLQVRVDGANCLVRINGETVARTDSLPEEARRPGRIGLQIHRADASVEFRDLRVRPLE